MIFQQQDSLLQFIGYNTPSQESQSIKNFENQITMGLQFENPDFTCKKIACDLDKVKCNPKTKSIKVNKKIKIQYTKYDKNLCGYILKKVIRVFIGQTYNLFIEQLCNNQQVNMSDVKYFYENKIQEITGLSHLKILLQPLAKNQLAIKKVFLNFLEWFLKEKYLRHIVHEGKMDNKIAYIEFKNKFFPKYIHHYREIISKLEKIMI